MISKLDEVLTKILQPVLQMQNKSYEVLQSIDKKIPDLSSSDPPIKERLFPTEVIRILQISERTYYRHVKNGVLVPRMLGSQKYYYRSDLKKAMELSKKGGYL